MAEQVQTIFVATESGLSISRNGGKSYRVRRTEHGLGSNFCRSVSSEGQWVFVATTKGLSVSSDSGEHFINKTTLNGLPDNDCKFVQALDDGSAIVMTNKGAAITRNGGDSFIIFNVENERLPSNICNDGIIQHNGFVLIGTRNGVAISRNFGFSFNHYLIGIDIIDASICHELNTIFIVSKTGLYRTPYAFQGSFVGPFNHGLSKFENIQTITTDEAGVVYLGTDKRLYSSIDKGVTFVKMNISENEEDNYVDVRDVKALRNSFLDVIHMGTGEDLEDTSSWAFHSELFNHDIYYNEGLVHIKFQNKKYASSWVDLFVKPYEEDINTTRMTKNDTIHSTSIPLSPGTNIQYWFKYEDSSVESPESEIFNFIIPGFKPRINHRISRLINTNKTRIWFKIDNGVSETASVTLDSMTIPLIENINGWLCADFDNTLSDNSKYSFSFRIDGNMYTSKEYLCKPDISLGYSISEQHVFPENLRIDIAGLNNADSVMITYTKDSNSEIYTYMAKNSENNFFFNFPDSKVFKNIKYTISSVIDGVTYCSNIFSLNSSGVNHVYSFETIIDEFSGNFSAIFTPLNFTPEYVRFNFCKVLSDIYIGSSGSYRFETRLTPDQPYDVQFFFTTFAQEFATEIKTGVYTQPLPAQRLAHYLANSTNGEPGSEFDISLSGGNPDTEFEFTVSGSI